MHAKMMLMGLAVALFVPLVGCNQRTLFKDTDTAMARRNSYFGSYDAESAKATADRRKKQSGEWGLGPNLFGGGSE